MRGQLLHRVISGAPIIGGRHGSLTRSEPASRPGAFYGVGEAFRRIERSYRLLVGEKEEPVAPGTILRNEDGDIIGSAGYDGIVTLTGRPGVFLFEGPDEICRGRFTGDEAAADLATLHASCEAAPHRRFGPPSATHSPLAKGERASAATRNQLY